MLFTQSYLLSHLTKIKCAYAEYTLKYGNALAYNLCGLDCMYDKLRTVGAYIDIIERFYNEGLVCIGEPPCQLAGVTFTASNNCTIDVEGNQECWPTNEVPRDINIITSMSFTETEVTATFNNLPDGTVDYTYANNILTLESDPPLIGSLIFSNNCGTITYTVVAVTGITYITTANAEQSTNSATTCDWASQCITPEEIQNIITHSYKLIDINCGC